MLSAMAEVREATRDDLPQIATSLADAFWDDPVTTFALPEGSPQRERRLQIFMRAGAKGALKHRSVFATHDIGAVAVWKPPGHWKVPVTEMLPAMPSLLYALRGRARLAMGMLTEIEKQHPTEPHWYLEILGTQKASQGKGFGSAVIAPVLERCDDEGTPAYLESSKESNIPFYERHGFRVTKEINPPNGAPTLWAMWRDPR
jgi:GNAT superfamily N-acetyltransferase